MRINKFLFFVCPLVVLLSCATKEEKRPVGILDEAQMEVVLTDILIVESYVASHNLGPDSSGKINQKLQEGVFKRHNISREQYDRSMNYYAMHPDVFEEIFQPVMDSLHAAEARLK